MGRLTEQLETILEESQRGSRKGRNTQHLISTIRQLSEKLLRTVVK